MRIANKCMKISPWGWDDITIIIAYTFLLIFTPLGYISEKAGAGKNIWTLTPEQITEVLLPKEKLGIMVMFGIGLLFTAVSVYRLYVLKGFARSYNITG
ncbi:putative CFEM domain-containing protein [Colletotrichum sublineola]|uniref:Putative CFEM domain-containing protein n=1 Tax=Colletotrichum sublineola TaxID=1173701 RepID=A0A066WVN9_COLSU|nr:putative CFEM domain-containing protein [Colletotrichum sublineola]